MAFLLGRAWGFGVIIWGRGQGNVHSFWPTNVSRFLGKYREAQCFRKMNHSDFQIINVQERPEQRAFDFPQCLRGSEILGENDTIMQCLSRMLQSVSTNHDCNFYLSCEITTSTSAPYLGFIGFNGLSKLSILRDPRKMLQISESWKNIYASTEQYHTLPPNFLGVASCN